MTSRFAADHLLGIVDDLGNAEQLGSLDGARPVAVAHRNELAQVGTHPAGDMRHLGPAAATDDANTELLSHVGFPFS